MLKKLNLIASCFIMSFLKVCMPSVNNRAWFPQKSHLFPGSLRQLMFSHLFLDEYHFIGIYKEIYNKRNCWDILWLESQRKCLSALYSFFFFDQCFLNLNVHTNLLRKFVQMQIWFSSLLWGLRVYISNKLPRWQYHLMQFSTT